MHFRHSSSVYELITDVFKQMWFLLTQLWVEWQFQWAS